MITKVLHKLFLKSCDMAISGWNIFNLTVDLSMNSCIRSSIGQTVRTKSQ